MATTNKKVFITGASGHMGWQTFQEIYQNRPDLDIVVLIRDSEKNRNLFAGYMNDKRVKIVWGDFGDYDAILEGITGASYVLHIGGMVSPAADYWPKRTLKTNVMAAENIVKAVKAQKNPDDIVVCYIGTVAETGNRCEPLHWGRCGDPIKISIYDHYAISKVKAERVFAESGLKKWVSLRQSGILYPQILKNMDPIMFHVPLNGVLEWATVEDSATLMERLCNDNIPDDFFRRFYNIGSGDEYRITNYQFEDLLLNAIGMGHDATKRVFKPNWFVDRNFHGQWYADGDVLEEALHFRHNTPIDLYFKNMAKQVEWFYQLSIVTRLPVISTLAREGLGMIALNKRFGTRTWVKNNNTERLTAFYGDTKTSGMDHYKTLPTTWDKTDIHIPSKTPVLLDHGYDETKPFDELTIEDLQKAAAFRGGKLISTEIVDMYTPVTWEDAEGNQFDMTPNTVLRGGHWSPAQDPFPWRYDEIAKQNPFFAQVWYIDHGPNENNVYGEEIYRDYDEYLKK